MPEPPLNLEAEEYVLGALMLPGSAIDAVRHELDATDFYRESHAKIYRAALQLHRHGLPVDAVTIADKLDELGLLEGVGGKERIREIASLAPATTNAGHHARIVREMATLRGLTFVGESIQRLGMDRPGPTAELVARAQALVSDFAANTAGAVGTLKLRRLDSVTPRQVRWLVPGMIPLRALTLLAGVGGLGKSTWTMAIAANLSTQEEPADTIIVSLEDPAAEVIRPRLEAAGANLAHVHELYVDGELDTLQLPGDIDQLERLVRRVSAKLIIIDPIVAAIEAAYDSHKDQHVRLVLGALRRIAEEHNCAVVIIGHLNKTPSREAYIRVANSVAFWNASRSVVLITEDPDEPDDHRLLAQRKANWARLRPVERHRLESIVLPETLDPETGKPIETSRMVFVETADDIDGADILGNGAAKGDDAKTYLRAALNDGEWHDSAGLKTLSKFNERMLQRAARSLDVESSRRGFPSSTYWRLPQSRQALLHQSVASEEMSQLSQIEDPEITVATNANGVATDVATVSSVATDIDDDIPF
jgi:hypothetical protein